MSKPYRRSRPVSQREALDQTERIICLRSFPVAPSIPFRRGTIWLGSVFLVSLVWFLAIALHLIATTGMTGDEPWYVLQGEALTLFHTLDFSPILHAPSLYGQFFHTAPSDHILRVPGTNERVLPYLPGYAAILGPLYVLGGRSLVVVVQSLCAAATATLLFREAYCLWRSRVTALFATLGFATALPVGLFAGQLFPSTFASLAALSAYTLVRRTLPHATGRRRVLVGAALGALCMLLPWLHVRYALLALTIAAAALLRLGAWPLLPRLLSARSAAATPAAPSTSSSRPYPVSAALAIAAPLVVSGVGILWYSKHFFGTWFPQYSAMGAGAYTAPHVANIFRLYGQMFFDAQSGLVPWVPLVAIAPIGLVVLARRQPDAAACIALWSLGLLGSFLSAAVAPHVNQAYALPARFSDETVPYLILGATAVFAEGWNFARTRWAATSSNSAATSKATTWTTVWLLGCLALPFCLLLADTWLTLMAQRAPSLLYPSASGLRLVMRFPHLLPGWWFTRFPLHSP